jgi:hypothetical protein
MITGISNKDEVVAFFAKWLEKQYPIIDEDDQLINDLRIACADDIVSDDVDRWANASMWDLFRVVENRLLGN